MPLPPSAPAPVAVPIPVKRRSAPVPAAVAMPTSLPVAVPAPAAARCSQEIREFSPPDVTSFDPHTLESGEAFESFNEEEKGPGVLARAVAAIGKLKEIRQPEGLDSIGPTIVMAALGSHRTIVGPIESSPSGCLISLQLPDRGNGPGQERPGPSPLR